MFITLLITSIVCHTSETYTLMYINDSLGIESILTLISAFSSAWMVNKNISSMICSKILLLNAIVQENNSSLIAR